MCKYMAMRKWRKVHGPVNTFIECVSVFAPAGVCVCTCMFVCECVCVCAFISASVCLCAHI